MTPVIADTPQRGFYKTRLVTAGPFVPVMIYRPLAVECHCYTHAWHFLDRWPKLMARLGHQDVEVERVWPGCAKNRIDGTEYVYRLRLIDWTRRHAPWMPEAHPHRPIDLLSLPPLL